MYRRRTDRNQNKGDASPGSLAWQLHTFLCSPKGSAQTMSKGLPQPHCFLQDHTTTSQLQPGPTATWLVTICQPVPLPLFLPSQDSDEKAASCFYFQSFGSGRPAEPPPACCTGASSSTRRTRHQLQWNQQGPAGFCCPVEAQDLPPAPPTCRG